jgi:CheY-like chemotaxis protein
MSSHVTLTFAENGIEAIRILMAGLPPNLILADAHMPLMSGHELLTWLMESPFYRHIRIVIWTGDLSDGEITRYHQAGANSVMMKSNALQEIDVFCKH